MPDNIFANKGRAGPLAFAHHRIDDLDKLRAAVQLAIQVEFTTIPAYLSALYSIQDKDSQAYQAIRSVVIEEMFHVNQAANLLIGIGGRPRLTGDAVPTYPTYLPSASRGTTPYVGLYRASATVFREVFMGIEMPAPYSAPAEGENYSTIGQFYKGLEEGLEHCVTRYGVDTVFRQAPGLRQRTDIYLGKFGGRAIDVRSLQSAKRAILQIVQQGEGAVDPTRPLVPDEPWGSYDHYGTRLDGTYGPILGTPYELSHYFTFKRVVESGSFPDTYPIMSNPRTAAFSNPEAREQAATFNRYYSVMLRSLEKAFELGSGDHDIYFEITFPLMHSHMPRMARVLVTTPITEDGDSSVGPTAAPTFEYDPSARLTDVVAAVEALGGQASPGPPPDMLAASRSAAVPATPLARRSQLTRYQGEILDHLLGDLRKLHRFSQEAAFDL